METIVMALSFLATCVRFLMIIGAAFVLIWGMAIILFKKDFMGFVLVIPAAVILLFEAFLPIPIVNVVIGFGMFAAIMMIARDLNRH